MKFSFKFLEKNKYYFKKFWECNSLFLRQKSDNKQIVNVIPENFRKIVWISIHVLVSKPKIEKKEILILISKHEIKRKKFSFPSRTWDWKKEILVPVSRIEIGFSSHYDTRSNL